jgi:hypothetical protein
MKEKVWWRVVRWNEQGRIIAIERFQASTRKEAKELAARYWQLESGERLTALADRSLYSRYSD